MGVRKTCDVVVPLLRPKIQADSRILAMFVHTVESPLCAMTLVLQDEALASFYQERHALLARWVPGCVSLDVTLCGPAVAFFTEERRLGIIEWIGWGQVPEYPFTDVTLVWDRSGRVQERLAGLDTLRRVEFRDLDRAVFTFWSQLWLARHMSSTPARCTFHASQAFLALADLWRAASRIIPQRWFWGMGSESRYAPLGRALPYVRDCPRWLEGLKVTMLELMERVAEYTGWEPPLLPEDDA